MKIYILPIAEKFQPGRQPFQYPRHNKDFGVEQDFHLFLLKHADLVTNDPNLADWHYLPVYWTRWHLNHDFAKTGVIELQDEVQKVIIDPQKTFVICQYDDGPVVDVGGAVQFLASRKSGKGIDIPLLSSLHKRPFFVPAKKYLAFFVGMKTHPIREALGKVLAHRSDTFFLFGNKGARFFVRKALQSYIALAPRGYGGGSFRLFEAMQLGVVPFLIGDLDTRPFKRFINWDEISLYTALPDDTERILDEVKKKDLTAMGYRAMNTYYNELSYQNWCKYVIKELENYEYYQ